MMTDQLLIEIRDELRALRVAIQGRQSAPDAASVDFVRAVHLAVAGRVFTSGDLAAHAALPAAGALRGAILGVCRAVGARPIGRALRRLEGHDIDGYCVERIGVERDGIVWRVACLSTAFAVATVETRGASSGFTSRAR